MVGEIKRITKLMVGDKKKLQIAVNCVSHRPYTKMADININILLFAFKIPLLTSFKVKYSFDF